MRIDKWLWAARFFKTRSLAGKACELGRIKRNGDLAKAAREIAVGDMLTVKNEAGEFEIEVLGLSEMRGPAPIARALYRETESSREARERFAEMKRTMNIFDAPRTGRPSKRDRRLIHRFTDMAIILLMLLPLTVRAAQMSDVPRLVKINDYVYTYEGVHPGEDVFTTTNLIVTTPEGVLIADGQATPAQTEALVKAVRTITTEPIRYVVIASDHPDHTGGNKAFPAGVKYLAHPATKAILKLGDDVEAVSDSKTINLGGVEIRILYLGRAHNPGPLAVYLPDERFAYLSEIFINHLFPQFRTGYPTEWLRTLDHAEALEARLYIGGHGFTETSLPASRAALADFHQELRDVIAEVTRLHHAHVPVEDAIKQANWGKYATWTGEGPAPGKPSPRIAEMGPTAVRRIYDELDGKLKD